MASNNSVAFDLVMEIQLCRFDQGVWAGSWFTMLMEGGLLSAAIRRPKATLGQNWIACAPNAIGSMIGNDL